MTIAKQLQIKKFPFIIKDHAGNQIYYEYNNGYWVRNEYDERGKEIYCENSDGSWSKTEWDESGNQIYYETSIGVDFDIRSKTTPEYTIEELTVKLGHTFKIKK